MIRFSDKSNVYKHASVDTIQSIKDAYKTLVSKTGEGNDFLGWLDLPVNYDKVEFKEIKETAKKIRKNSQVLVVIGIGGSYLGAKACIEMFKNPFPEFETEIIFAGHNLSDRYLAQLVSYLERVDFSINVISKSGTTTEPAIAFRVLRKVLINKYGEEEAKERIFCTTDKAKGALKELADKNGYKTFVVPDDVGGRYSVLTAVGLLPIAVAGIDINRIMEGAQKAREYLQNDDITSNEALQYAATRLENYKQGKCIEILATNDPRLVYFAEWWKQLFGESEGKDGKGLFPVSVTLTTDLHSLGQMIQDGNKDRYFETFLEVTDMINFIKIHEEEDNSDQLNYLAGKYVSHVNNKATLATVRAHKEGGVNVSQLYGAKFSELSFGYMVYFFEFVCGVSAYALGVNPFNQPGVEAYKKNMFHLLGKEGY